jgi:hypothetical protein
MTSGIAKNLAIILNDWIMQILDLVEILTMPKIEDVSSLSIDLALDRVAGIHKGFWRFITV